MRMWQLFLSNQILWMVEFRSSRTSAITLDAHKGDVAVVVGGELTPTPNPNRFSLIPNAAEIVRTHRLGLEEPAL